MERTKRDLSTAARQRAAMALTVLVLASPEFGAHRLDVQARVTGVDRTNVQRTYGSRPLSFEANEGQTDARVKFVSRGAAYSLFLTPTEAVLVSKPPQRGRTLPGISPADASSGSDASPAAVLRMALVGSNPDPVVSGVQELPGKSNYFKGAATQWRTNVPHYAKVLYRQVYPGIDLVYYGNSEGLLEHDFIVAPGADPNLITLAFDGPERVAMNARGELVLHAEHEIRLRKPVIFQEAMGVRTEIAGSYVIREDGQVGFRVARYDVTRPLIIDPVLTLGWSTFLGGTGAEGALGIAVRGSGVYVVGQTLSVDFPVVSAAQPAAAGDLDQFVAKLTTDGTSLVYATYLGGTGTEGTNADIAADASGNAYIAASTNSADFPVTTGAYQTALSSLTASGLDKFDGYVTKLSSSGALVYSTFLGGTRFDTVHGIDVDASGSAYVTGYTLSIYSEFPDVRFPTVNAIKSTASTEDGFVTKLNPSGSALVYSTYLGGDAGNEYEVPHGIAVDASGNAYVTGMTGSTDFPTVAPVQASLRVDTCPAGKYLCGDAFVAKINAAGSAFVYSTFLGGGGIDRGVDVDVDASGTAYIVGDTASTDFPTMTPLQAANGGGNDLFVAKLAPAGNVLEYSTYLGGSGDEGGLFGNLFIVGSGIVADGAGNAYVTAATSSADFPAADALQPFAAGAAGDTQVAVAKLNPSGSGLVFSTPIGGPLQNSRVVDIGVDSLGGAYVAGGTLSTGFPTVNALQPNLLGPSDAFVAKVSHSVTITVTIDIKPGSSQNTINLGSNGVTQVAILSSATFDATTVDPSSVTLASAPIRLKGNGSPQAQYQDSNNDGLQDLVVHVETEAFQLTSSDVSATLEGETFSGTAIRGTDTVRIVP